MDLLFVRSKTYVCWTKELKQSAREKLMAKTQRKFGSVESARQAMLRVGQRDESKWGQLEVQDLEAHERVGEKEWVGGVVAAYPAMEG